MRAYQWLLLLLTAQVLLLSAIAGYTYTRDFPARYQTASYLKLTDLFIANDCYSVRNPAVVDFAGCFRDFPVQICYHASCTALAKPEFYGFSTRVEVER